MIVDDQVEVQTFIPLQAVTELEEWARTQAEKYRGYATNHGDTLMRVYESVADRLAALARGEEGEGSFVG